MTIFKTSFSTQGQVKLSFVELMCKSLLWEGRIAQGIQTFLTLTSYIQGVLLLLWGQIQMLPTENKEKVIADISNYMENVKIQAFLDQFFLEEKFGIVLGFLWFYFFILIATMGIIYWNQRSNQYIKSNLSCFITYLTQLHILHSFWLINVILQYYFSVQSERATFFENSGSISHQAQSLVLLILNYLFAYMFAFFAYNPFAGPDFLSCHSNTFQILSITVKALLFLTLTIFSSDMPVQPWIFAVVSVVICSARYYKLLKSFPYYNYKAMRMHIICSSIEMVVVIVSFVGICLRSSNDSISFGVLAWADVLLLPFAVIFGISFVNKVAQQYSVLDNEVLKSEDDIVKKVFSLTCLIQNSKLSLNKAAHRGIFDIYFWGNKLNYSNKENLQKQQSFKTKLAPAFLMTPEDFSTDQMSDYYTTLIDSRINRTLKSGIQRLSQNNKLRAILAYRNINSSSPFILALLEMCKISQRQLNNRIIASKLYDKLQISLDEFFEEKTGKVLNLKGFLKLQTTSDIFTKMINSNTKKYVEFWSEYFKPRARIVALREKSIEIEKESDEINNFWNKYTRTDKEFGISNHMIYALYISLTRAEAFEAFRITEKYRMISENQANNQSSKQVQVYEEQLNNEQVFVIYASMAKENLGRITYASQNVEDLLEWAPAQLVGQNIGVLLPDFLSQTHHQVLLNHAKEGFPVSKMMRNISTYIRDKKGNILHCDLRISIYPYVQASPIYVAAVRIDPVQRNNILFTQTGEIEGFTQNIGKILELSIEKKSYIQSLCQSNKEFEKIKNFCELTSENAGREEKRPHESLKDTVSITMSKDYEKEDSSSIRVSSFMLRVHPLNRHAGSKEFDQKYQAFMSCQSLGNASYFVLRLDSLSNKEDEEHSLYSEKEESEISEDLSEKKIIGGQTSIKVLEKSKASQTVYNSKSISIFKEIQASHTKHTTSIKVKAREIENKKRRDIADIDTMMSTSLGSSTRDRNNRLERLLMKVPKDKKLSIFNILIILFAVISGVLLTYFQFDNRQTLDLVQNSIETLSQTIFLCLRFTDFNAYTRIVWMIQDDIYRDNRYVEFGFDITSWDFFAVFVSIVATEVNERANNIRNFIDKLDPQLQTKFYEDRIPVWDASLNNTLAEQPQYYNFFDLVAELSARGNRILPSGGPYDDRNPDVVFCANYTYNDLLLAGEQKIPLLIEDNQLKLNNQVTLVGGIFGALVALSLCILYLFFRIERDYIKTRNQFIMIIAALDSNAIHNQLTQVKDFLHYLQMKESKDKKSVGKINQDKLFMMPFAKPEKAKGSHIPKRVFDNKGLNLAHIALFLSASTVFILLFSFAPILLGLTIYQKQQVLQKMNLLATSDNYSFRFVDLLNQIYAYGQFGGDIPTRNIPVREDFELNYEGLQYAQDFLLKEVLNPKYGLTDDPLLVEMITGSLCDTVQNSDPIVTANCPYAQGGILEKGVIGLNSALLAALDETRRCFDSIERTHENIVDCFLVKGYLFIEIYYPFAFSAYSYIDTLIRSRISQSIESSRNTIFILLFFYFGVSVAISSIIWFKTQSKLEKVIMGWRRMIKQIPHTVLSENRALKTFIMKNSDLN